MLAAIRHEMADVTTGLYMISALAVASEEHRLQFGNDSENGRPCPFGIHPDWIVWAAMAANLKPMAADLGQSPR